MCRDKIVAEFIQTNSSAPEKVATCKLNHVQISDSKMSKLVSDKKCGSQTQLIAVTMNKPLTSWLSLLSKCPEKKTN